MVTSQTGIRTWTPDDHPSIPHRRDRIDLTIVANISRLIPPTINLMEYSIEFETASLTEYPLMHLVQNRDLQLEVDEVKKAIQHEVWNLFHLWHPRSTFHLTVATIPLDSTRAVAQTVAYDSTLEEVINLIQLPPRRCRLHFQAIPNEC